MDRSECRRIVEANLPAYVAAMALVNWRITVEYGPIEDADPGCEAKASCLRMLDYERAKITIDPQQHDDGDEADLLASLRHELFHVVLAPFDLFHAFVNDPGDFAQEARLHRVWRHSVETGVRSLERLWEATERHWRATIASEPKD